MDMAAFTLLTYPLASHAIMEEHFAHVHPFHLLHSILFCSLGIGTEGSHFTLVMAWHFMKFIIVSFSPLWSLALTSAANYTCAHHSPDPLFFVV